MITPRSRRVKGENENFLSTMCGIHLKAWKKTSCSACQAHFGTHHSGIDQEWKFRDENLRRRGPDAQDRISIVTHPEYFRIECLASVLQMRAELTDQPVAFVPAWTKSHAEGSEQEEQNAYLCWNGEIYQHMPFSHNSAVDVDPVETFMYDVADTTIVARHLETSIEVFDDQTIGSYDIASGDDSEQKFSALPSSVSVNTRQQQYHIANVMEKLYNAEFAFGILTNDGFFYGRDDWGRRSLLRWDCPENCGSFQIVSVAEEHPHPTKISSATQESTSANLEWTEVPPGMVHCVSFSQPTVPVPKVCYRNPVFPLPQLSHHLHVPSIPDKQDFIDHNRTISDRLWKASLELEFHLRKAVAMRLDQSSSRRSTGVLFSGGVDSVVLATLAADILSSQHREERLAAESLEKVPQNSKGQPSQIPILYLYNVSFGPDPEKSADRKAALKSYETLREKYQRSGGSNSSDGSDEILDIEIIFRDIVVEWEDICQRESHIRTLLSPKHTVMDINIATALWFASKGITTEKTGTKHADDNEACCDKNHNERPPRVLLLGMGADELMGGYGRHRKAYEKGGWRELQNELTMDQNRLWERNCGRDDRLCSDHGREARFPFLDANVVRFLRESMENEDKLVCDFTLPPGVGDKRILRIVAERLGMDYASGLVKRAIQFGSRISHLSDTKRFGSRRKAKGVAKI